MVSKSKKLRGYPVGGLVADDGNGVIEFQYFEVNDVDQTNNFSTVGIESPDERDHFIDVNSSAAIEAS